MYDKLLTHAEIQGHVNTVNGKFSPFHCIHWGRRKVNVEAILIADDQRARIAQLPSTSEHNFCTILQRGNLQRF